ncbi:MAG: hypothetical protein R2713_10260 [Ilumatobacteraceae bacterium]
MGHAVEKLLGDLRTSIHAIAANSEALAAAAEELQAVAAQMGNAPPTRHTRWRRCRMPLSRWLGTWRRCRPRRTRCRRRSRDRPQAQ